MMPHVQNWKDFLRIQAKLKTLPPVATTTMQKKPVLVAEAVEEARRNKAKANQKLLFWITSVAISPKWQKTVNWILLLAVKKKLNACRRSFHAAKKITLSLSVSRVLVNPVSPKVLHFVSFNAK